MQPYNSYQNAKMFSLLYNMNKDILELDYEDDIVEKGERWMVV